MILLVHHGDALGPTVDASRPLSSRGLVDVSRLAEQAVARGVAPDVIWHSGKLRARQTAEAFWGVSSPLPAFAATRGLLPDDPPDWMRDRLIAETRSIVLVSHMPYLPRLLHLLVSGRSDGGQAAFPLHGCVALDADGDGWRERWRLEP